jgi:hypothetical protein
MNKNGRNYNSCFGNRVDYEIISSTDYLRIIFYWFYRPHLPQVDDFTKQQCLDRGMLSVLEEDEAHEFNFTSSIEGNLDTFYITGKKASV